MAIAATLWRLMMVMMLVMVLDPLAFILLLPIDISLLVFSVGFR